MQEPRLLKKGGRARYDRATAACELPDAPAHLLDLKGRLVNVDDREFEEHLPVKQSRGRGSQQFMPVVEWVE